VDDGVKSKHRVNSKSWFYFAVKGVTKNTRVKFTVSRVQTLMAVFVHLLTHSEHRPQKLPTSLQGQTLVIFGMGSMAAHPHIITPGHAVDRLALGRFRALLPQRVAIVLIRLHLPLLLQPQHRIPQYPERTLLQRLVLFPQRNPHPFALITSTTSTHHYQP
jgi:hypothetical protein